MARIQDTSKTQGLTQRTAAQTNAQDRRQPTTGLPYSETGVLDVVVTQAVAHGNGFICSVQVISGGAPTGMTVENVGCAGTVATGDPAIMNKSVAGWRIIPLGAGGSASGSGGTTNYFTTIVYDVFSAP